MNPIDYYYKGYDISNKNKLERLVMEYDNPYGYNFFATTRRKVNLEKKYTQTSQDIVKNKEFNTKKS